MFIEKNNFKNVEKQKFWRTFAKWKFGNEKYIYHYEAS